MIDLTCFGENYIGIRGECGNPIPTTGIYVNDLPGVTLSLASHLTTEENVKGVTLLRQIEGQAIRQVWQDIKSKLLNIVTITKVIDNVITGEYENDIDDIEYLAPVAANVGLTIEKLDFDPYTEIRVNSVMIRGNTAALGQVLTISDGLTPGCNTQTFTFDLDPCKGTKVITNFRATSGRVYITVDATALELEDLSIGRSGRRCGCSNPCSGCCNSSNTCFSVDGWDGTKEVSQAYGMIADVSCVCSETEMLCSIQGDIAMAVQMQMGILLAKDLLVSKRCNFMVRNSKDDAMNMLSFWLGNDGANGGLNIKSEYWRTIGQTVASIKNAFQTKDSKCIACGKIKIMESLP